MSILSSSSAREENTINHENHHNTQLISSSSSPSMYDSNSRILQDLETRRRIKNKLNQSFEWAKEMSFGEAIEKGWMEYSQTKKNVKIYQTSKQIQNEKFEGHMVIRGDVLVEKSTAEEYMRPFVCLDMEVKKILDPLVKRNEDIEMWTDEDGTFKIQYFLIGTAPFVSDRDFIYVVKIGKLTPNITYVVSTSIHSDIYEPPCDFVTSTKAVRSNNYFVSNFYEELEDGNLKATYCTCSDPQGWIPKSIVNAFLHHQPLKMADIAKVAEKNLLEH